MKEILNDKKIFIGLSIIELVVIIILGVLLIKPKIAKTNNEEKAVSNVVSSEELDDEYFSNINVDKNYLEKNKEINEKIIDKAHELNMFEDRMQDILEEEIDAEDEEEKKMQEEMKQDRIKDQLREKEMIKKELKELIEQLDK